MGPSQALRTSLRNAFRYSGRATRSEFWWLVLAAVLVTGAASALDRILWPDLSAHFWLNFGDEAARVTAGFVASPLNTIAAICCLVLIAAAMVRRLHDAGLSGKLALVPLLAVCLVVAIIALSIFVFPDAGASQPVMICLLILITSLLLMVAWLCRRSDPHQNRYGPPPFEVTK
ncbi:DUF805 domain-containing protein [Paragemmobacter ruber]|uniref:DUF805 domain-containing protein n=1 Tax=Paragemmobacter ruber TaxID=1985673 RepID=A0ABW9Y324_9RHOB|nr:DUF805 domain-containing protein [Rhodobacter ruber]NBE06536.1 DUF805 domain-containing protein [Rhodobacter ruber]